MNNYFAYAISLDYTWFQYVNSHRWYVCDHIMPILTLLGDGVILICLISLLCLIIGPRAKLIALHSFTAGCLVSPIVYIIKHVVQRLRPPTVMPDIHVLGPALYHNSFPSGHTAASFVAATILAAHCPRLQHPLFIVAALVGYSRIYLGVHFPLDVFCGAFIGIMAGRLVIRYTGQARIGLANPLRPTAPSVKPAAPSHLDPASDRTGYIHLMKYLKLIKN